MTEAKLLSLIPLEDISCIYFVYNVVKTTVVTICYYTITLLLECIKIINYSRAEERFAIGNRGFEDDDLGTFGLDALHDALDGTLAEVIAVGLHGEAVDTNDATLLTVGIPLAAGLVIRLLSTIAVIMFCGTSA